MNFVYDTWAWMQANAGLLTGIWLTIGLVVTIARMRYTYFGSAVAMWMHNFPGIAWCLLAMYVVFWPIADALIIFGLGAHAVAYGVVQRWRKLRYLFRYRKCLTVATLRASRIGNKVALKPHSWPWSYKGEVVATIFDDRMQVEEKHQLRATLALSTEVAKGQPCKDCVIVLWPEDKYRVHVQGELFYA